MAEHRYKHPFQVGRRVRRRGQPSPQGIVTSLNPSGYYCLVAWDNQQKIKEVYVCYRELELVPETKEGD